MAALAAVGVALVGVEFEPLYSAAAAAALPVALKQQETMGRCLEMERLMAEALQQHPPFGIARCQQPRPPQQRRR